MAARRRTFRIDEMEEPVKELLLAGLRGGLRPFHELPTLITTKHELRPFTVLGVAHGDVVAEASDLRKIHRARIDLSSV